MAGLSTLCPACTKVLYTENGSSLLPQHDVFHSHHPTLLSVLDAVKYGCFICRTVWENVNYQSQATPLESNMQGASTAFRLYRKGEGEGLRLAITFQGQPQKMTLETKFELLPSSDCKCYVNRGSLFKKKLNCRIPNLGVCRFYHQQLLPVPTVTLGNFFFNDIGFGIQLVPVLPYQP